MRPPWYQVPPDLYGELMQEKSSLYNPCETAAVRVQYWFGKDKVGRLHLDGGIPTTQDLSKKHQCKTVKAPRLLPQIDHLPLQGYVLSKRKRQTKTRHVTKEEKPSKPLHLTIDGSYCNVNQKNLNSLKSGNKLSAARVAYGQLKEYFLVSKKLKNLPKQTHTGPKHHKVVSIKSSSKEELAENPYQDWGKIKLERHFHLGRVIKYFTDI